MRFPLVSAIIVTYNNREWLLKSIASVLAQSYSPIEVIVVDNGSVDQASGFVRREFPTVKVVELPVNRGFGAGNNAGVAVAKGKYLFIGNDDLVLDRDCFREMVSVMENDSSLGACQGTIYQIQNSKFKIQNLERMRLPVQSTGLFFNYTGVLVGDPERAHSEANLPVEIFAAGGPFLVRRNVFDKLGGFDEDFFLYFEEVDLCWRIWFSGKRVVYVPLARMYHKGGATTSQLPDTFVLYHSVRNRIASFVKNLGWPGLLIGLGSQLLTTFVAAIIFFFRGKFLQSWAIFKAWGWNIRRLPQTMSKRTQIQDTRGVGDRELLARVGGALPLKSLIRLGGVRRIG